MATQSTLATPTASERTSWVPMIAIALGQMIMSFNVASLPVAMGGMVNSFGVPAGRLPNYLPEEVPSDPPPGKPS